jgi:hypothetical protein
MIARSALYIAAVLLMGAAPVAAPGPAAKSVPGPATSGAAARPALTPTRDVVVGYHLVPASGETIDVRVSLPAGGQAMRLDLPDQSYMVAVPPRKALVLVVPLERTVLEMPWSDGPQGLFLLDDRMRFTPKGDARGDTVIAGQRCTQWDTVVERNRSTVCVTPDGVVLRSQSQDAAGRRNLIEAFAIRYQALVESDFAIPASFDRLSALPSSPAP